MNEFESKLIGHLEKQESTWFHFEGREVESIKSMIKQSKLNMPDCLVSVEFEKKERHLEGLYGDVDVLIISTEYSGKIGSDEAAHEYLTTLSKSCKER